MYIMSKWSSSLPHSVFDDVRASVIALYRPYMAGRPGEPTDTQDAAWRVRALQKAKIAASNIDGILNKLAASQMIQSCHPMMCVGALMPSSLHLPGLILGLLSRVTAVIPALQIHLFESVSGDPTARYLGRHNLNICMFMMGELRQTYWAAGFIYSLFHKAVLKLDSLSNNATQTATVMSSKYSNSTKTGNATSTRQNATTRSFLLDGEGVYKSQFSPVPVSMPNEYPEIESVNNPASSRCVAAVSEEVHDHQNQLGIEVPNDIDLALAYDIFSCGLVSDINGLASPNFSSEFWDKYVNISLSL